MRNSKKLQALADNCAKAHGFLCASYRGCTENELIYVPLYSNSDNNPQIPAIILIRDNKTEYICGGEYFSIFDEIRVREFKKGRTIYNALYHKFQKKDFECDNEETEEHSIVVSQLGPKKPWINKNILYDYLEIAERLGMKVELCPNRENSIDDEGNWMYHVELRNL